MKLPSMFPVFLSGTKLTFPNYGFMKQVKNLSHLLIVLLLLGCKSKTVVNVKNVKITPVDTNQNVPIPPAPTGVKVSAYLIYDNGSISTFDVLNDKTKALWNTIIGAGDAEKPSTSTKIKVSGQVDSLRIIIINGKKKVIDQNLLNSVGDNEFIIENTGCEIVDVQVTKRNKTFFKGEIEFHCGE
jgi:hypothetical protein